MPPEITFHCLFKCIVISTIRSPGDPSHLDSSDMALFIDLCADKEVEWQGSHCFHRVASFRTAESAMSTALFGKCAHCNLNSFVLRSQQFQIDHQTARQRGCIYVTLVAFVRLLKVQCQQFCLGTALLQSQLFQMCPQIARQRGCIVTLVAFVQLFSTV